MITSLTEKAFVGFRFLRDVDPVTTQTVGRVNKRICNGVVIA
jgi:hypothetical protein